MVGKILVGLSFPFLILVDDHFDRRYDNFVDCETKVYIEIMEVNSLKNKSI